MSENYSIKKHCNTQLIEIFNEFSLKDPVCARGLVAQDNIKKNAILFIGINPSYPANSNFGNPTNYYNLIQKGNEYKRYFSRFEDISEKVNIEWTHIDLFYFQNTGQKLVNHYLDRKNVRGREFLRSQLAITKDIIRNLKPKVVVVSNALARDLFGCDYEEGMQFDYEFDEQIGTHLIKSKSRDLNNTPIFFTSMLTGSRALDNGSYRRLIWHIKTLNKSLINR